MSADEDLRAYDSRTHRTPANLVLHSSAPDNRHQSTYLPSSSSTTTAATSNSAFPAIVLPAQDFSSESTANQRSYGFELPVRGRYEPQNQGRRVSIAGFDSLSNTGASLANPTSTPYYSPDSYQQAVAQFQARRSRSQPPRPETGAVLDSSQPPQRAPATMSAFAQILPSPSPHFGQGQDFYSSAFYSPHLGYDSMSTLPDQSYFEGMQEPRQSTISPHLLPSSPPYGSTTPRISKAVSRSPPTRERTPIRHHRPSISRNRSGSRPEVLLAYAEQHQHQHQQQHQQQPQQRLPSNMPSQSAPNTPPIYQHPAYVNPPITSPPLPEAAYYPAVTMPHSASQYLTTPSHSSYATSGDPNNQSSYFNQLTRSISQPTLDVLSTLNPQDAMYNLPNRISLLHPNSPPLPSLGSHSLDRYPAPTSSLESSPEGYRVLTSRPKPQCFDHGCNGRQFSTFSNLLRHQREKSGSAMKAVCPHCGTEFTRTTARNGHLWGGKCKGREGEGGSETVGLGEDVSGAQDAKSE